ncbi:hypothetical protein [Nonomuraea candida]|uniref:hypothetical protein n=1 Tax=Nonomuraea candida TaxID=359159 RepID=UPI0005B7A6BB|nr:hypothetical protein [Nonomuraea candida]
MATRTLADTYNSHHEGENRTTATIAYVPALGTRRVIGPTWGGTLNSHSGRIVVYADHEPEPIGTVTRYTAGARMLAKHHGVPVRRLDLDDEH